MLRVLEKRDGESLKNFTDVVEGADGKMVVGIIQSLKDTKNIQDLTFKITSLIEIAIIIVNIYGLFTHKPYYGVITFPIVWAVCGFSKIVRKENLEFLDFLRQGFGWEDVTIKGSKAVISIRGHELDVDVIRVKDIEEDLLDIAGRKLYIKEE